MKKFIVLLTFFLCISAQSAEKDTRTPFEAFYGDTQFALIQCGISFRFFQLKSKLDQMDSAQEVNERDADYQGCINTNLRKIVPTYRRAVAKAAHKPKAVTALKSYYAAWISTLHGITPGDSETKLTYAARQAASQNRLVELWAMVGIEISS